MALRNRIVNEMPLASGCPSRCKGERPGKNLRDWSTPVAEKTQDGFENER